MVVKKVVIIVNLLKSDSEVLLREMTEYFRERKIDIHTVSFRGKPDCDHTIMADLALSLGGDGTALYSARILPDSIPILAVNLGSVGFITEISKDEWKDTFEKFEKNKIGISERRMLDIGVFRQETKIYEFIALNDCVVSSDGIAKMTRLHVSLAECVLGEYRADGVIISTPTGSTAYSGAAGGPILDPEMEAMIINPICPYTLSNRPLVVPGNSSITVDVDMYQRTNIILSVDGQTVIPLQPGDRVMCVISAKRAKLIRSDKRSFYEVLRTKLRWSGAPDA